MCAFKHPFGSNVSCCLVLNCFPRQTSSSQLRLRQNLCLGRGRPGTLRIWSESWPWSGFSTASVLPVQQENKYFTLAVPVSPLTVTYVWQTDWIFFVHTSSTEKYTVNKTWVSTAIFVMHTKFFTLVMKYHIYYSFIISSIIICIIVLWLSGIYLFCIFTL